MVDRNVTCVLVIIHGVGNQKSNWSTSFDRTLKRRLAALTSARRGRFATESVWWANLSVGPGTATPAAVSGGVSPSDVEYALVEQQYARHLLGVTAAPGTVATAALFDPRKVIARLRDVIVRAADGAADVANYVSHNGVRLQIQHRLSNTLFRVQQKYPNATIILGSHSQGTIIAYDVLRLNGKSLPAVKTWITMGSPLQWYVDFLRWGDKIVGLNKQLTWLNLFDKKDPIGKTLRGVVKWNNPVVKDIDVDNVRNNLDPHDHWHSPVVVGHYFDQIKPLL